MSSSQITQKLYLAEFNTHKRNTPKTENKPNLIKGKYEKSTAKAIFNGKIAWGAQVSFYSHLKGCKT